MSWRGLVTTVDLPFGFVESGEKVGLDAVLQFRRGENPRPSFFTLDRDGGRPNL
jgi:hypothetical protein